MSDEEKQNDFNEYKNLIIYRLDKNDENQEELKNEINGRMDCMEQKFDSFKDEIKQMLQSHNETFSSNYDKRLKKVEHFQFRATVSASVITSTVITLGYFLKEKIKAVFF